MPSTAKKSCRFLFFTLMLFAFAEAGAYASECINNYWQPTFVHDTEALPWEASNTLGELCD